MKLKNISSKIIGIGDVTILPGETKEIPVAYETSPILEVYKDIKMAEITGKRSTAKTTEELVAEENAEAEKLAAEKEELRKQRLESLGSMSDEDIAKLASELGINPAECKDQADVKKKVAAALKK